MQTHTITFDADGKTAGEWWNYAFMTSPAFAGTGERRGAWRSDAVTT